MRYEIRTPEDLGRVVADRRRHDGQSQSELAGKVGLSQDYLSKIERGRTSSVTNHVFRILRRMGATIIITFEDEDDRGR